ncbi:hypothetical protein EMQ25_07470 [Arsenicitalea aurantiaca]|uniref:MmcQ/YjbR family DNA-binding protein n=1 Tax=Arsenicitalea aurantiaca TaxID=1783274 RepID=A0A433XFT1_9HYPH|nr:MmcQ/YjbR family DNA-binding protein [Arsenicitalea aurantiaca]RUT32959.1 hypothetical protein EMQ25_07470 [Arsenicitalea aurantiaca]
MVDTLEDAFSRLIRLIGALELPEVDLGTSHGTPALIVAGKTFARVSDPETLVLKCPIEQKELLLEIDPDIYFQTDHHVGWPTLLIRLPAISDEELSLRLADGWRFMAPDDLAPPSKVPSPDESA